MNPGILELVLILLATAVLVVVIFRVLNLPALLGYLLVGMPRGSAVVGKIFGELDLPRLNVQVHAIRRRNIRGSIPDRETRLTESDVVVLRSSQEDLEVADMYL